MIHSIFSTTFFRPSRPVYQRLETPTSSAEYNPDNIGDLFIRLEESVDADLLRETLLDWIDSFYPELSDRLAGRSIGTLLDAATELRLVDLDSSLSEIVEDIFEQALDYNYPGDSKQVMSRVKTAIHAKPSPYRPTAIETGNELIDQSEELTSPRLTDLRRKLRNLQTQYNTYYEVSNKAAVQFIKGEVALKKILEGQGFQYDRNKETENFYYFDKDYGVNLDERSPGIPQEVQDGLDEAIDTWRSWGQHYDRSNRAVERYEVSIKKVEAQIRIEKERLRNS